jgi:hypothetical protein
MKTLVKDEETVTATKEPVKKETTVIDKTGEQETLPQKKEKADNNLIVILVVVLVLTIVAFILYNYFAPSNKKEYDNID